MFSTRAKRTAKKLDSIKVVLLLKSMSFGCTMVTLRSETLLYMSTPHCRASQCTTPQEELGDHALHCCDDHSMKGSRHDRILDVIFAAAQCASLNPQKELPGLIPGSLSLAQRTFLSTTGSTDAGSASLLRCNKPSFSGSPINRVHAQTHEELLSF